jgi:hypothetical protein
MGTGGLSEVRLAGSPLFSPVYPDFSTSVHLATDD